jgi:hypothetical protein
VSVCTHCHGTGVEPVNHWTDDVIREDASARLEVDLTVREPVAPPEDVLRAEIGTTDA